METRAFKRARLASQRAELGLASAATEGETERVAWHVRMCGGANGLASAGQRHLQSAWRRSGSRGTHSGAGGSGSP